MVVLIHGGDSGSLNGQKWWVGLGVSGDGDLRWQ